MRSVFPCFFMTYALLATASSAGTPSEGVVYVSELQTESLYRVAYSWDGASSLSVADPELVAIVGQGGGIKLLKGFAYVSGAGVVSRVDLATGTVTTANSFNNANGCGPDLAGANLYCGWRFNLSRVSTQPFGDGTLVNPHGDDVDLTTLAFTPDGGVFYTTGTEGIVGDFGSINLATAETTRLQTSAFATSVAWDAFSGKLLVSGLGRSRLINPFTPTLTSSQRDDSGMENYLSLSPDGLGHALGTQCCVSEARLVMIDYSQSGDLASPATIVVSVPIPGLTFISGEAALDLSALFVDGFE